MEQRTSLSWALAIIASIASTATPASAQVADPGAWENELAWLATTTAQLDLEGRPEEALRLLETVPRAPLVDDRVSVRRLVRITEALHAPGAEPGWFHAGLPIMIAGVIGVLPIGVLHIVAAACGGLDTTTCSSAEPDHAPFLAGYAFTAGAFLFGAVLNILGLVNHTFDPERRAFERRRTTVIRAFLQARRGIGITW